jgi:hypothetical protein
MNKDQAKERIFRMKDKVYINNEKIWPQLSRDLWHYQEVKPKNSWGRELRWKLKV